MIIEVDKYGDKKTFTAHSTILRDRSIYLNKELADTRQSENNIKTIYEPDISAESEF